MRKITEKEAYEFFDKWIRYYVIMSALILGVDWQPKITRWEFDIVDELIDNNGTITVARVRQICGFEEIRQLDYLQGWAHPL